MQTIMLFAVPPSRMTTAQATAIAHNLGHPSKLPGAAWGISARMCVTGAKLRRVRGSTCSKCYALKGRYVFANVADAHARRLAGLSSVSWVDAMVRLILADGTTWFRWFDSGDLQSLQHLLDIVRIAERLEGVRFWLPTRERALVAEYLRTFGDFPPNLTVRVSAAMIDGAPPAGFPHTSTVHATAEPMGRRCPAPKQAGKCGDCRACWNRSIANVSYHVH